ncbi:MAG: Mrp/NBP35 family ATP-binding protein [Nitrospirae bacterium]|nr:Mrp/NBP35 family ATP-binding protein [Nitrospirota bacterium]
MQNNDEKKQAPSCPGSSQSSCQQPSEEMERQALLDNISKIKHKIIVLSGKGGVGKSTVAANIAIELALRGKKTGLMDIDIHGPSIPKMLGIENVPPRNTFEGLYPSEANENLKAISIGFFLKDQNDAVIWRAPLKHSLIKQFLTDIRWGELDYLIIDCPPGTGDEPLSVIQLLEKPDGAVVVTTPQDVSLNDVRKSVTFCGQMNLPVIGVVENMSGFKCPKCGEVVNIFKKGGGSKMAEEMGIPFLAAIPIDPNMVECGDSGKHFATIYKESDAAKSFAQVVDSLPGIKK